MPEMSPYDRLKENIPAGGKWFWYQNDMIEAHEQEGGVRLAWQKKNEAYAYGLYPGATQTEVMESILSNPPDKRWALEWIPADTRCKGFVDVDIKGEPDTHHKQLADIVQWIREKFRREFSSDLVLEIHVCCGSRYTSEGEYKNSYHIVINNLIFENNHDGTMQNFFDINLESLKLSIDAAVYSRNRLFRLPHNSKQGGTNPLYRISGDPTLDQFNHRFGESIEAVLPFFVSDPEPNPCAFLVPSVVRGPARAPASKPEAQAKDGRASKRQKGFDYLQPPFPLVVLKHLLEEAGDSYSTPKSTKFLENEQKWQIQCDASKHQRRCLVTREHFHEENNILLFVGRFLKRFKVELYCPATECKRNIVLGYIWYDDNEMDWCHELTLLSHTLLISEPVAQDQEMESPLGPESMQMDLDRQTDPDGQVDPDRQVDLDTQVDTDISVNPEQRAEMDQQLVPAVPFYDPDNAAHNTYQLVKERFEQTCFNILKPFMYVWIVNNEVNDPSMYSHNEIRHVFHSLYYWSLDEEGKQQKNPFITRWLADEKKRTFTKIGVYPKGTNSNHFNMWKGYDAAKLPSVPEADEERLVSPLIQHVVDVITCDNKEHTDWLLDYMANIVQFPERKTEVAILLYGEQGTGKGIIFEFLRTKVLGTHCTCQTAKPENDLLGRFSNGLVNRVLVQIDEVRSLHDYSDQLKDIITNPTFNYEKKGKDIMTMNNYANLVLTSNNKNSLTVPPDDRRFVLFECSSIHKGDEAYFNELGHHLNNRPEVARAVYQYLMSRDLSEYRKSFQASRPVTEYYREVQRNCIPVHSRFLSALLNMGPNCPKSLKGREFYEKYERFHKAGNYMKVMTETAFGRENKKVTGLSKEMVNHRVVYTLCAETMRGYLDNKKEYDCDAEYPDAFSF